jgi:tRNA-dihydrouridine synthase A
MMAWTDRHCRYLLRLCSRDTTLFTEMISADALLHGPRDRLLRFDAAEHPIVVQLGGSDPGSLAEAAHMAEDAGFDEINLNVGCPSERVQRGRFGACLMLEPGLVGDLVAAMAGSVSVPVTVKCRLGVDDQDSQPLLETFVRTVAAAGCGKLYVHARKAVLGGLTPAQNRDVPPLQPERVYDLKQTFPELEIHINGGIRTVSTAEAHLANVDGVMIGREAYHRPLFLAELAAAEHGAQIPDVWSVMDGYQAYVERELATGTRLHDMTRHCLGLFSGMPGARRYRQILSDGRRLAANDPRLLDEALTWVRQRAA